MPIKDDERDSCAAGRRPDRRLPGIGSGVDSSGGSDRVARGSYLSAIAAHLESSSSTRNTAMGSVHRPVLVDEVLAWLAPREDAIIVDGTVGGGGHAGALSRSVGRKGRVIGLD